MPETWFISDTHFGHANIIRLCDRPFANVEEMNETLRDNWNALVAPNDYVYHLGDVYFGHKRDFHNPFEFLRTLNGNKRLILGNHDSGKDQALLRWADKIYGWRLFPDWGLVLTHVPVHPSSLRAPINVHGHVHNASGLGAAYLNVSVEVINYRPLHIDELLARIR